MWMLGARAAFACAGLVHEPLVEAESGSAEVVFEISESAVFVTYEVVYDGDADAFGWIVPATGGVLSVADGDAELLRELREVSAPLVIDLGADEGSGGCGCGAAKGGDNATRGGSLGVTVVSEGFTGTYDYQVVHAASAQELADWMDQRGFVGSDPTDLDHYVALGADFVLLEVAPDVASTPSGGRELPPIRLELDTTEARFPSVMARHASVPTQRTTVYVLGEDRAEVAGWSFRDVTAVNGEADADPWEVLDARLAELGDGRGFGRTWAGDHGGRFLTRFDTLAPREQHDVDALFSVGDGVEPFGLHVVLGEADATLDRRSAAAGLLGLLVLVRRRRRQRTARTIAVERQAAARSPMSSI